MLTLQQVVPHLAVPSSQSLNAKMDDILKKAMFSEVSEVMERIEEITKKYNHCGDLVYTAAFGFP